ncbi:MAG: mannitol-1-phosphate 5-dehydrogenase [Armatimonadetes bacterium]|nr:mannitol-1-phosphate 5-dehydrogenase [Armatimonadota bacterium]
MKLIQFGAGNIGRSFVAQLFSRAGYEVVFVDVMDDLVNALNEKRRYRVEVRDVRSETIWVENVRAVNGKDREAVAGELASADIAATAVGPNALPYLYPTVALGAERRLESGASPLDIIICENLRGAASHVREGLRAHLPGSFPLEDYIGLVETSIGKMVPIMTEGQRKEDLLWVFAEAYNTLILDRKAFRNPVPDVPGLSPKDNMAAYVDRKLFIHNLGHAVAAYLGYLKDPSAPYLWQAVGHPEVQEAARRAMWESARSLIRAYPQEFDEANQGEHIEDLLRRFGNRVLGDTVYRVGRDLTRKLSPEDRLIGALNLDLRHGLKCPFTCLGIAAALRFRAADEKGQPFPQDREFIEKLEAEGIDAVLASVGGLKPETPALSSVICSIKAHYDGLAGGAGAWLARQLEQ